MEQGVYNDWKIARLNPVFKKDDETEIGNYRPISLLNVPNKILESCVADALTKHVLLDNRLVTNNQWVYRKGYSTELLLAHLTETWRRAIDSKQVVGVVFIDFQKAFDSVSHTILIHKLKHYFRIDGYLLDWLKDYLSNRKQFTVMNGIERNQIMHKLPMVYRRGRYSLLLYLICTRATYLIQSPQVRFICTRMIQQSVVWAARLTMSPHYLMMH